MCGRYTLHTEKEALARRFALEAAELEAPGTYVPRYNVAPTQPLLALVEREGRIRAVHLRWGLVPHWTAADAPLPSWINARAESAAARPAFRDAFARQRCLIPASGFYEWETARGASRHRIPHWIARRDGQPFAMAGIWARWRPPAGPALESCAILTTAANAAVASIHDRMPVILRETAERAWLSSALDGKLAELAALLEPIAAGDLVTRPVSPAVNSAKRDAPELIERWDDPQLGFMD
jgi:putative SOS response-associated peptidase YedK